MDKSDIEQLVNDINQVFVDSRKDKLRRQIAELKREGKKQLVVQQLRSERDQLAEKMRVKKARDDHVARLKKEIAQLRELKR